jgi:hypothetical protein
VPQRMKTASMAQAVVITQRQAESAAELTERAAARLSDLDGKGQRIGFVLLACGQSGGGSAACARTRLADVALGHLSRARNARLVLTAARRADAELRHALVSLADRALSNMGGKGGTVSIWFGDDGRW